MGIDVTWTASIVLFLFLRLTWIKVIRSDLFNFFKEDFKMVIEVIASSFGPVSGSESTVITVSMRLLGAAANSLISAGCIFRSTQGAEMLATQVQITDQVNYTSCNVVVPRMIPGSYEFSITLMPRPGLPGDAYLIRSGANFTYEGAPPHPVIHRISPNPVAASRTSNLTFTVSGEALELMDISHVVLTPGNRTMTVLAVSADRFTMRLTTSVPLAAGTYTIFAFDRTRVPIQTGVRLHVIQ